MKRIIIVTGTPGTGKTTLAKKLAGRMKGSVLVSANDVIRKKGLFSSVSDDGAMVARMGALEKEMKSEAARSPGTVIIEGHLLCEFGIRGAVVIVVREHLRTLRERMRRRGYPAQKARDNLTSEAIGYCASRARDSYSNVHEIMGGKGSTARALRAISDRDAYAKEINLLGELRLIIKEDSGFLGSV